MEQLLSCMVVLRVCGGHLSVDEAVLKASVLRQLSRPCCAPIGAALHHHRIMRARLREPVLLLPLLLREPQR